MKPLLIEIDDRSARDLERIAPATKRMRTEFVRLAIRRALDVAMDRATRRAYARLPSPADVTAADVEGWDAHNRLAIHASGTSRTRRS